MRAQLRTIAVVVSCAAIAPSIAACGTFLGLRGEDDDDTFDPSATATGAVDAAADSVTTVNVAVCSDGRTVPAAGLFVSVAAPADASDCTREAPCSLPKALDIVRAGTKAGSRILLAPGTYVYDLDLPSGADIEGGFRVDGAVWTPECDQRLSVLVASQASMAVRVASAGDVRLSLLTVESKANAIPGESIFGVVAVGKGVRVTLDNVVVSAGPGGAGVDGSDGIGLDLSSTNCDEPGKGIDGAKGADGSSGAYTFGSRGAEASDGSQGAPGEFGQNGTAGSPGQTIDGNSCTADLTSSGCLEVFGGTCNATGTAGRHGCGGMRGKGGFGGKPGGASVALFAWEGAEVVVDRGALASANGGAGGAGGSGTNGAIGSVGSPGENAFAMCAPLTGCGQQNTVGVCENEAREAKGGFAGGQGGAGGGGGRGGGGPGGPSFAVVSGGGATIELANAGSRTFGSGGAGGAPNGAKGNAGELGP
jgi:hypothetical protein